LTDEHKLHKAPIPWQNPTTCLVYVGKELILKERVAINPLNTFENLFQSCWTQKTGLWAAEDRCILRTSKMYWLHHDLMKLLELEALPHFLHGCSLTIQSSFV